MSFRLRASWKWSRLVSDRYVCLGKVLRRRHWGLPDIRRWTIRCGSGMWADVRGRTIWWFRAR